MNQTERKIRTAQAHTKTDEKPIIKFVDFDKLAADYQRKGHSAITDLLDEIERQLPPKA